MAEKASAADASAAVARLKSRWLPNAKERETSRRNSTVCSRSSTNFLTWRCSGSGGDVPVHRADVVARGVLADLGELHPLPLEGAQVGARQRLGHQLAGADLDVPHPGEQFRGGDLGGRLRFPGRAARRKQRREEPRPVLAASRCSGRVFRGHESLRRTGCQGTSTASSTRRTISSPSTSSASAS